MKIKNHNLPSFAKKPITPKIKMVLVAIKAFKFPPKLERLPQNIGILGRSESNVPLNGDFTMQSFDGVLHFFWVDFFFISSNKLETNNSNASTTNICSCNGHRGL